MNEYPSGSSEDRKMLAEMPAEKLLDYFFLQIRNLWRVDGLYFLSIERKFGTEAATEIDAGVWEAMAAIEAKGLQRMFKISENPDVPTVVSLLRKSSWALDQPFKTVETTVKRAVLSVDRCRTQETRLSRNLSEFPCKKVRFGYLKTFAKTLNPNIEVNCLICPPDKHPEDKWCKWEFMSHLLGLWPHGFIGLVNVVVSGSLAIYFLYSLRRERDPLQICFALYGILVCCLRQDVNWASVDSYGRIMQPLIIYSLLAHFRERKFLLKVPALLMFVEAFHHVSGGRF